MADFDCKGPCSMCNNGLLDAALDDVWEAEQQRIIDAVRSACASVWFGADEQDARAWLDHLMDIGFRVVAA